MINVFQPTLQHEELAAIERVFASNWLGKGALTAKFEQAFAAHLNTDVGLIRSVNSCTEGLFQAMNLLDIGDGDEVILPTISFVGAGNAIVSGGAKPVFCDVDPRTLNPTANMIEAHITSKTKAVIILHYGGVSGDMVELRRLTDKHNIALIEDCACSVASRWKNQACGTFGDVAIWSFDAMKILVTGDGGMIWCRTPELAEKAASQLYLGLQTKSGISSAAESKWWEFEIDAPGRRSIMNDISSAMGLEQLKKLATFITRRRDIHNFYDQALADQAWLRLPPSIPEAATASYYFYWIQTQPALRNKLAQYLRRHDIYTTFRYYPLHWVRYYESAALLPNAEQAANATLCLPLHQSLTDNELAMVVERIIHFGREYS